MDGYICYLGGTEFSINGKAVNIQLGNITSAIGDELDINRTYELIGDFDFKGRAKLIKWNNERNSFLLASKGFN
jgi:hypothetical protein